jgi:PPOX class probable F420-dependent enzyme
MVTPTKEDHMSETTEHQGRPIQRAAADPEALLPGRFLSVTSFKRDGTGVATPVWAVADGARLLALTDLHSAKIRRIRRNPHVLVAPCRAGGGLRGEPVWGHAEVLTSTPELERVRRLLLRRYNVSYRLVMLIYRLGRRLRGERSVADGAALAITVEPATAAVPTWPAGLAPPDDGSHTPPHGDALAGTLFEHTGQ